MAAPKIKLTPAIAAALASGAPPPPNLEVPSAEETAAAEAAATAQADAEAAKVLADAAAAEAAAALAAAPAVVPPVVEAAGDSALVAYLKGEITTVKTDLAVANAELVTLRATASAAQAELSSIKPVVTSMTGVIRVATQRLAIALNSSVVGLDSLEGQPLTDTYNQLNSKFEKTFNIGAKSSTAAQPEKPEARASSPRQTAAVAATKRPFA